MAHRHPRCTSLCQNPTSASVAAWQSFMRGIMGVALASVNCRLQTPEQRSALARKAALARWAKARKPKPK